MALRTHITERQRRLGSELRKLREAAGLSVNAASSRIGLGAAHLSHIEAARTAVSADRLVALLYAYDVRSEPYIATLTRMAESDGKGWWTEFRKSLSQHSLDLAELESRAAGVQSYETLLIPGLLQTEAYMRALFYSSRPGASPRRSRHWSTSAAPANRSSRVTTPRRSTPSSTRLPCASLWVAQKLCGANSLTSYAPHSALARPSRSCPSTPAPAPGSARRF